MSRASSGNLALDLVTNRVEEEEDELEVRRRVSRGDQFNLVHFFSLSPPINFRGESRSQTTVDLVWTNTHGAGAVGIELERAKEDGAFALIDTLDPTVTFYNDTGLETGTRYRYRLRVI